MKIKRIHAGDDGIVLQNAPGEGWHPITQTYIYQIVALSGGSKVIASDVYSRALIVKDGIEQMTLDEWLSA